MKTKPIREYLGLFRLHGVSDTEAKAVFGTLGLDKEQVMQRLQSSIEQLEKQAEELASKEEQETQEYLHFLKLFTETRTESYKSEANLYLDKAARYSLDREATLRSVESAKRALEHTMKKLGFVQEKDVAEKST